MKARGAGEHGPVEEPRVGDGGEVEREVPDGHGGARRLRLRLSRPLAAEDPEGQVLDGEVRARRHLHERPQQLLARLRHCSSVPRSSRVVLWCLVCWWSRRLVELSIVSCCLPTPHHTTAATGHNNPPAVKRRLAEAADSPRPAVCINRQMWRGTAGLVSYFTCLEI